jgi:hypothetical protein
MSILNHADLFRDTIQMTVMYPNFTTSAPPSCLGRIREKLKVSFARLNELPMESM